MSVGEAWEDREGVHTKQTPDTSRLAITHENPNEQIESRTLHTQRKEISNPARAWGETRPALLRAVQLGNLKKEEEGKIKLE